MVAIRRFEIDAEEVGFAAQKLHNLYEFLKDEDVGEDDLVEAARTVQSVIEDLSDWLVTLHAEAVAA